MRRRASRNSPAADRAAVVGAAAVAAVVAESPDAASGDGWRAHPASDATQANAYADAHPSRHRRGSTRPAGPRRPEAAVDRVSSMHRSGSVARNADGGLDTATAERLVIRQ